MRKLILIGILSLMAQCAYSQLGQKRTRVDTLVSFTDISQIFVNDSSRFGFYVQMDSTKLPPCPPSGRLNFISRGLSGLFVQFSDCSVHALDSVRIFHWSLTGQTDVVDSIRFIQGYGTILSFSGHTLTVGVDTSKIATGYDIDSLSALKANKTTTITIAANTPLSSSAGAQDLSANRTWTLSIDTSTVGTGVTSLYQNSLKADKTTTISAGTGLTGGGSLAANRTISADSTSWIATDYDVSLKANNSRTLTMTGTSNRLSVSGGTQDLSANRTWTFDIDGAYVGQSSITTLGTIGTGTWQGTKIGLAYGGTNADLSATGGTSQYLKQSSSGAAVTVGTIPASDIASPANLSVGTSLSITSGTGTGATLQSLGLNTIQGIRTADSPQFTGLTLSGITSGSVLFAGTSGVVSQDNSNLFWNDATNTLGLGINSSLVGVKLDVTEDTTGSAVVLRTPSVTASTWDGAVMSALRILAPTNNSTRNFESAIRVTTKSATIDKGRGIIVENQNSISDGIYINNKGGGVGIGIDVDDQNPTTTNSIGIVMLVDSSSSQGLSMITPAAAVSPTLLNLNHKGTTAAEIARISITGNAAHTGLMVRNIGANASANALDVQDNSNNDKFTIKAQSGNTVIGGTLNVTGTTTIATPFTLGATSVTSTGTQLNYLNAATGTTGTTSTNLVFSTSPTFVTPVLGAATGTSLTLSNSGADFLTGTGNGGKWTQNSANSSGATLTMKKSRAAGASASNNDAAGNWALNFVNDATTEVNGGLIRGLITDVTSGSEDMDYQIYTNAAGAGLTEKVRITSAGNVGIGDVSPASLFTVGSGDKFQVNSSGTITSIAGVATEGLFGAQAIVDTIEKTAQNATIAATNFNNAATAGEYTVDYNIFMTTAGSGGTVAFNVIANNGTSSITHTSANVNLNQTTADAQGTVVVKLGSGNVQWSTTVTGSTGSPLYTITTHCRRTR